ncbi:MAG: hypothetical protein FJX62_20285 [Alphaproteobacteria bacterium]|nr:hypothetical protein [Alphaproteobacteria bacterium]
MAAWLQNFSACHGSWYCSVVLRRSTRPSLRRALAVAAAYVLVLQAMLAGFATALAVAKAAGGDLSVAICHGVQDAGQAQGGSNPADGVPCAHCALSASAHAVLPEPPTAYAALPEAAGAVAAVEAQAARAPFAPRDGPARAPPDIA